MEEVVSYAALFFLTSRSLKIEAKTGSVRKLIRRLTNRIV